MLPQTSSMGLSFLASQSTWVYLALPLPRGQELIPAGLEFSVKPTYSVRSSVTLNRKERVWAVGTTGELPFLEALLSCFIRKRMCLFTYVTVSCFSLSLSRPNLRFAAGVRRSRTFPWLQQTFHLQYVLKAFRCQSPPCPSETGWWQQPESHIISICE